MRRKKQKPPIFVGGSEKLHAADCPRYMNVPFPAPCHVAVAGVRKQSVWGLRIIACSSVSTVTSFPKFVNTQKWRVSGQFEAAEEMCHVNGWLHSMPLTSPIDDNPGAISFCLNLEFDAKIAK
jgi:hypothetical protein